MVNASEAFGSIADSRKSGRHRTMHISENIARTQESIEANQFTSICHHAQELDILTTSLFRILHDGLDLKAYKISLVQKLEESDHERRRNYCYWLLKQSGKDCDFLQKIIMSDEAQF